MVAVTELQKDEGMEDVHEIDQTYNAESLDRQSADKAVAYDFHWKKFLWWTGSVLMIICCCCCTAAFQLADP